MKQIAINYKSSNLDIGAPVKDTGKVPSTCKLVSAGHPKHAYSTAYSWIMVQEWFEADL